MRNKNANKFTAYMLTAILATSALTGCGSGAAETYTSTTTVTYAEDYAETMQNTEDLENIDDIEEVVNPEIEAEEIEDEEIPEEEAVAEETTNEEDNMPAESEADSSDSNTDDTVISSDESPEIYEEETEEIINETHTVDESVTGTMYATVSLNVRSGPSTNYGRIGSVASGAALTITGQADTGWYRINYAGGEGYVSNAYVSAEAPVIVQETTEENTTETVQENTETQAEQVTEQAAEQTVESNTSWQSQVAALTNAQRTANGVAALAEDSLLMQAAQIRAEEMAAYGSIRFEGQPHTRTDGTSWTTVLGQVGYAGYTTAGENMASGQTSPEAVVTAWMDSEGHRANILNGNYTKIGVGCACVNGVWYWCQLFGN